MRLFKNIANVNYDCRINVISSNITLFLSIAFVLFFVSLLLFKYFNKIAFTWGFLLLTRIGFFLRSIDVHGSEILGISDFIVCSVLSVSIGLINFSIFFVLFLKSGCLTNSHIPNRKYGSTIRHYLIKSFALSEIIGKSGNSIR